MTEQITFNAGKFLLDGNEIVNPEVLSEIGIEIWDDKWSVNMGIHGMEHLKDGQELSLPATLRAEVEYQYLERGTGIWKSCHKEEWDAVEFISPSSARKVVRLVEVESKESGTRFTGRVIGDMKLNPETNDIQIVEPKKQAIDERVSLKKICTSFFYWWWNQGGSNTEQGFDKWMETDEAKALLSSQPPPQAESQEEIFDDLFSRYLAMVHSGYSGYDAVKSLRESFLISRQ